ncbi:MAG: aminoacetone oxidase family FAD-binding enzyme, partial [Alphaproteobacteria bacterium]
MFDVIIIGGGASGFAAAKSAISRNLKVAILDMGATPLRKVAVSGGGKCNFTNLDANYTRYFGNNPDFVRSALSKITPNDVLEFVSKNNIKTFQKTYGQFFVDGSSQEIINALLNSVKQANIFYNSCVNKVEKNGDLFAVYTDNAVFNAKSVIIATGGLSYSVLGVSDAGFKIAKSFGHKIVPMRPALCGIKTNAVPNDLSGVSMPVKITVDKQSIYDNLLFTHFGLGGPAIYKSTVRNIENGIVINFMPDDDFKLWIKQEKQISGKRKLSNVLAEKMPVRVAKWIVRDFDKNIADLSD